jgi:FKBP-type peptidyl-prolyl cis-trans isomerase FkpA
MKNLAPILLVITILFTQCKKKDNCPNPTTTAPASEVTALETYLTNNNITATKDSRGFYYTISTPGGSSKPDNCATITVKYKGMLTNGSVFDQSTSAISFPLANLIIGWQQGIPLIGITGKIRLYLPPTLGYGSSGSSGIPGNSILIFDVELIGF